MWISPVEIQIGNVERQELSSKPYLARSMLIRGSSYRSSRSTSQPVFIVFYCCMVLVDAMLSFRDLSKKNEDTPTSNSQQQLGARDEFVI